MVDDAVLLAQIDQFAEAGADLISLHVENANAGDGLQRIAAHGLKAGMVLLLRGAGAETVVMGSLAFGASDLAARMRWLHSL